jgi:hypothetical protein
MITKDKKRSRHTIIFKWEMVGIPLIFLAGALVHFVFEWSGDLSLVGIFAPVNESVWEHFKLGFWPTCVYAAIEWLFLRGLANNFMTAKAVALYIVPLTIGVVFYAYTAILGEEILAIDILSFLVAVALAQFVSYRILTVSKLPKYTTGISVVIAIFLAVILAAFSFLPPHWPIFMDSRGFYGIP